MWLKGSFGSTGRKQFISRGLILAGVAAIALYSRYAVTAFYNPEKVFGVDILFGDANNDRKVDEADYTIWLSKFGQSLRGPENGDFDSNGVVDGIDYTTWLYHFGEEASQDQVVSDVTDNTSSYPESQVPKYGKLEVTFNVATPAVDMHHPYDPAPPAGLTGGKGVSVDGLFTKDNWQTTYTQPAFYYQVFQDEVKNNKEWFYPTTNYAWKLRFAPNEVGNWQYKIRVIDANGTFESPARTFAVAASESKGFIKVSPNDSRYFEYDNGTYFPALGYNMNGGGIANVNPILGNTSNFQTMDDNGIEFSRIWITQFSIFGEAYGKWASTNRVNETQEPRYGIINPLNAQMRTNYPNMTPPTLPSGSEYYMMLEFDETLAADGTQPRFTPCRVVTQIPVKQNTTYRVRVRYKDMNIEGPRVAGQPYGFTVKSSNTSYGFPTGLCNEPTSGTVLAASYNTQQVTPDPQNPGWNIMTGTFTNGSVDFIPHFYMAFHNAKSQDADLKAGNVFIDKIWLEEDSCPVGSTCANLLSKPWMSMHMYINQRDAYAFDKLLDLAKQKNIYIKAVMNEKNDRIMQTIDFNGQPAATQSIANFYGNRRTVTKVRWLQQAWWRYMQARWGYSPNIHSWELLNEGHPGNSEGHWDMADEFGKYMQCRVFGVAVSSANPYENCQYDHPNNHLVNTSFFGGAYPWQFWNNQASGVNLTYAEMDYVDQHVYATEGETDPALFNDPANFSNYLSTLTSNFAAGKRKPFVRGEVAWNFTATNPFEIGAEGGEWLHDFIWAGINHGGLMEHFFAGGHYTRQIIGTTYDHRPMFGTFYRFIKDVPLNNGRYIDAAAVTSNTDIRAWGQKDIAGMKAHLWIANKRHTWKSVLDGLTISPITGTVKVAGFAPNTSYRVEWWNTYTGQPSSTQNITSNAAGEVVLDATNLTTDIAVKIGYN